MKFFYYIKRFWEIPAFEKLLLIKALILNFLYLFIVQFLPLKFYSFLLEPNNKNFKRKIEKGKAFNLIRKTICRTSIILPWNISCLIKSFIFKHLANKFGITCTIAIEIFKGSSKNFTAHAYVLNENKPVYLIKENHSDNILYKRDMK
jgi:hypothetical protein